MCSICESLCIRPWTGLLFEIDRRDRRSPRPRYEIFRKESEKKITIKIMTEIIIIVIMTRALKFFCADAKNKTDLERGVVERKFDTGFILAKNLR